MKKLLLGTLAALALAGCTGPSAGDSRSSGSLAISKDNALLYAADTDNGVLGVVDVKTGQKLAEVKVGNRPWRVTVTPDDTIYVANRGSRSVIVLELTSTFLATTFFSG